MKKYLKMISPFNNAEDMPKVLFVLKKLLAFFLIYISSMFLAEGIVILIHFLMGYDLLQGEFLPIEIMTIMKYYGFAVFFVITILYCKCIEKRSLKSMGFNGKVHEYLKGITIGVMLLLLSIGLIMLSGNLKYNNTFTNVNYLMILVFLGGFVIQGAMEEALCRGFLMTSLSRKVSIPLAILISTLVFVGPHLSSLWEGAFLYSFVGIINLLLVSIIFSLLIINGQNIWIAWGMHSFWNFFVANVFGLNLSGSAAKVTAIFNFSTNSSNILNGGDYGIEASIITTGVLLIATVLMILKYKKIRPVRIL